MLDQVFGTPFEFEAACHTIAKSQWADVNHTQVEVRGRPLKITMLTRSIGSWTVGLCLGYLRPDEPPEKRIRVYPIQDSNELRGKAWAAQGLVLGHTDGRFACGRRYDGVVLARSEYIGETPENFPAGMPGLGFEQHGAARVPTLNGQIVDPKRTYALAGPIAITTTYDYVIEGIYDEAP